MLEMERKRVDGCAIFWRASKFTLLKEHLIEFNQVYSIRILNTVSYNISCVILQIKDKHPTYAFNMNYFRWQCQMRKVLTTCWTEWWRKITSLLLHSWKPSRQYGNNPSFRQILNLNISKSLFALLIYTGIQNFVMLS